MLMDELTTYLNISNVPVSWMPEIRAVSYNQSQAVRTLIREALDARKARAEAEKGGRKETVETGVSVEEAR